MLGGCGVPEHARAIHHGLCWQLGQVCDGQKLPAIQRGSASFVSSVLRLQPFLCCMQALWCFSTRALAGLQEGHCSLFSQNHFSAAQEGILSGLDLAPGRVFLVALTQAFCVSPFLSEQSQSAQHCCFSSRSCSPLLDSVCEDEGQVVLQ